MSIQTMEAEFLQLCKTGAADKVAIVLAEKRVNVNMTDPDGMTPLMHAGRDQRQF